jgi:redox-sensitive bicupin YhaK (pirin superfamily)
VRPHPHIGLATVTYLFDGEIMHRDSLGSVQPIRPGDVNWMVAGNGIVHSERTPPDLRAKGFHMHGIQSWVGLPKAIEETAPSFVHYPGATLPVVDLPGARLRIVAGSAFGAASPVVVQSPTLYVDAHLERGARVPLPASHGERALYVVEGAVHVEGTRVETMQMAVLNDGADAEIIAYGPARVMLLGGAPLDGVRLMWWNFVASDETLMNKAKTDWLDASSQDWLGRFKMPPGESEFIPLPE